MCAPLARLCLFASLLATTASAAPDFVLITIDTLRSDHLGSYGYPRDTSPNIDAFAAESLLFENAIAPMPMTLPSHVTLLTSSLPARHGVLSNFRYLKIPFVPSEQQQAPDEPPGLRSVAQLLAAEGYVTAAITSASPLSSGTGIDAGFEHFDAPPPFGPDGESVRRTAGETIDRALDWLESAPRPFFLWLHLFDPHLAYEPPPPHDTAFETDDALLALLAARGIPDVLRRYAASAINRYDGEIRYTDEQLGRLLETLRGREVWDSGVIALAADHGEGLLEHGDAGHELLWRASLGVPLLLRWPEGPRGERSARLGSLLDVLPTLAAHTALPLDAAGFDGTDLLADAPAEAFAQQAINSAVPHQRSYVLQTSEWKLWHRPGVAPRLYEVGRDPREMEDVSAAHPDVVERMLSRVNAILEDARSRPGAIVSDDIDPDLRERLRQLGYAD